MTTPVGPNTGHGHVWERKDGIKARCGGPVFCKQCKENLEMIEAARNEKSD